MHHIPYMILKDIRKLLKYMVVIEKERPLVIFLYSHHCILALMHKYNKRQDLMRPDITRFATNFLSLDCLVDKKSFLAAMVSLED